MPKVKKKVLNNLNFLKEIDGKILSVGFINGERYPDDEFGEEGLPVASVAYIQEFGINLPVRAFMRPTIENNENNFANRMSSGIQQMIEGDKKYDNVLKTLGEYAKTRVIHSIESVYNPPLAKITIELRRKRGNYSTKPLIDTELMINSVDYEITG